MMPIKPFNGLEAAIFTIAMAVVGYLVGSLLAIPGAGAVVFAIATMGGFLLSAIHRNQ